NIVDVTNYIMLLTGQPLHAYDYDLLSGHELGARQANKDEKATLLNGKTYQLDTADVVIVDGERVIGLGGVMGGNNSEVSNKTKNIVLECATFDMYAVRRTSMRHGLFTDAVTRFNKGQSPLQNEYVLSLAMKTIFDVAGGVLASQVFDIHGGDHIKTLKPVTVSVDFINARLGLSLSAKQITGLLTNVEFSVEEVKKGKEVVLSVAIPFWRTDIQLPEDIVEEVGRLYGFDKLPKELPSRSISPAPKNMRIRTKQAIRETLSRVGANEVLTYSFVHEKVLKNSDQDSSRAFKLSNALSPELQYYRLSILPSLIEKVHGNIKNGFEEFALFEIGKGHDKTNVDIEGLPVETDLLELIYTSKTKRTGAPYFHAQRLASDLCTGLGVKVTFDAIPATMDYPGIAPYDQRRAALIKTDDNKIIGVVGELKQSVRKNFKLPDYCAAFSFDIASLESAISTTSPYIPLSKFPSVTQDISLKVPTTITYAQLNEILQNQKTDLSVKSWPISIYQSKDDTSTKTITYRLEVTSNHQTLTDSDVSYLLDTFADAAKRIGAVRS
ncbi:MAG: phenylalanine--tRNA ligase subunit beta, partial [Candidatus Saccharimonadales bacterium]